MPTGTLPKSGKKLWESVYQESKKAGDKVDVAARKAWAAVKQSWKKVDGKWMKKSELISEFSMYITKASVSDGVMSWTAVNSDTDHDSYGERMSIALFNDFISNIKSGTVPTKYKSDVCSEAWCGGMPYVSISHYPDLDGLAVPGEVQTLYVDGNKLKAKGYLFDNPLGRAVWKSLKEDKNKEPDDKIRISIGFLDMAHKHGEHGEPFIRESDSICPLCLQGVGDKIYLKGHLVHLALTRVPVNKRTEMVLEEKSEMAKKRTRKEDAESIVGDLAEEIEEKNKASKQKSDALIEMSETEEETQELIAEAEANEDQSEEVENRSDEEPVEEPAPVVEEAVEKGETFEDATMTAVVEQPEKYNDDYPLNGAISMRAAEEYLAAKSEMEFVLQSWSVFSTVAWNIIERQDVMNKKEMFMNAIDEFRNLLSVKSMVVFSEAKDEHELKPAIDALLDAVDNSVGKTIEERSETINPVLAQLGTDITDYIEKKSDVTQPVPEDKNEVNILDEIKNLIQPIADGQAMLKAEIDTLKSQAVASDAVQKPRIPQPRTAVVPPMLQTKSEAPKSATPKLRDIIERSVR